MVHQVPGQGLKDARKAQAPLGEGEGHVSPPWGKKR